MPKSILLIENLEYFDYVLIAIAAVGSAVIKNGVGVGAGIFMLPFLSLALPAKFALGLGAPIMLVSDVAGVANYWKEWNKRELLMLLPPAVLGVILGASMITIIPNGLFRFWVGIFAIWFSSFQLLKLRPSTRRPPSRWVGRVSTSNRVMPLLFGLLGGVASSVIHAGGLVMSFYLIQGERDKRAFVGTFVLFFAIINLLKVLAYLRIDILNTEIVVLATILSPLMILGGLLGNALNKRVSQKTFRAVVLGLILLIGINLLMKT